MKRTIPLLISILILGLTVSAQSRRTFDNFDTAAGVQVIRDEPAPELESASKKKGNGNAVYSGVKRIAMSSSRSLRGFSTGDATVDAYILDSSRRYRIDPLLIYAQMHQESGFHRRARSYKGASGLMQLMPATARRFGVTNIYDAKQNIDAGVKYMRWLIDTFDGDVVLALAGYNAGEGAVMKYGNRIPPYRETQEYVRRIASRYNSITDSKFIKSARKVDAESAKKLDEQEVTPLSLYEPDVMAVRLPNGKVRLVTN